MKAIDVPAIGIRRMLRDLFDEGLVGELEDLLEVGRLGRDAEPNGLGRHDRARLCQYRAPMSHGHRGRRRVARRIIPPAFSSEEAPKCDMVWLDVWCFLRSLRCARPPRTRRTGSIGGKVTAGDGSVLPGVTVEARSNVLPTPRVVTTGTNGEFRFPALLPGKYTVTFTLSGMQPATREADVQLGRETPMEVKLDPKAVTETVTVTAESSMVDKTSPSLTNGLSADQMKGLPIGQDYRDLIRFIPGVQYTPDTTRGPSAGGSGQDNVYKFDGVNVTLPLFGTLSAEPASHDVAQVTIVRGGAQATQFDRSGGFLVDSVSRSGTNRFGGQLSYPVPEREHDGQDREQHHVKVRRHE